MRSRLRSKFSTKLIVLLSLAFIIPVATSLVTIVATSRVSLDRFDKAIAGPSSQKDDLIRDIFPKTDTKEISDPGSVMKLLKEYEKRRTFGLFMSLFVISFALAAVVILLSVLVLKRGMLSLSELSEAAIQVGDGDLNVSLVPRSHDEFADLVEAFGTMTKHLKETMVSKERAEESSRLRSEFLANMSHEIRTPLNGILGLAELLAEEETNAERKSNLTTIRQCGQNLLHLINEILELSKLEAGRMVLHPTLVAIADVIKEATATIEIGCKRKGLELQVTIDPNVPPVMEIDNHKLFQILVNLLGNAIKFTDKGFIRLSIDTYSGPHRGDFIFTVADSGVGIDPSRQQHIFESFVQGEPYLKRSGDGTGLGLAISKKLISLMGGDIWLESSPGRGSAFYFTITGA